MKEFKEISLKGKIFVPFIKQVKVQRVVKELSKKIYHHYQGRTPVFVGVLNGVIMFLSDFLKNYPGNCEIAFIQLSSYHDKTKSSGIVDIISNWPMDLTNREIVIFEDIIDTGTTLNKIYQMIQNQKVKNARIATLFYKPGVYKNDLPIDYIGMSIANRFIVGYGLDFGGIGRNIPDIYQLKTKMKHIVLFGPPGSGKGTQAKIMAERFHLKHLSTGDLFRSHVKLKSSLGLKAKAYINQGLLVPDEITTAMLKDSLEENIQQEGIIYDGYPRTLKQALSFDELLKHLSLGSVNAAFFFDAPDELLIERLLLRRKIDNRLDDIDPKVIKKRIVEYYEKTTPLSEYYRKKDILIKVDAKRAIEEISLLIESELKKLSV